MVFDEIDLIKWLNDLNADYEEDEDEKTQLEAERKEKEAIIEAMYAEYDKMEEKSGFEDEADDCWPNMWE